MHIRHLGLVLAAALGAATCGAFAEQQAQVMRTGGKSAVKSGSAAGESAAFSRAPQGDALVLNLDKTLEPNEGFEKSHSPAMDDSSWTKVERVRDTAAGASAPPSLIRASKLFGREVRDRDGRPSGEVKDVAVNLVDGRIRYYVLERDGRQAHVRPDALSLTRGGEFELKASLDELRQQRSAALEK